VADLVLVKALRTSALYRLRAQDARNNSGPSTSPQAKGQKKSKKKEQENASSIDTIMDKLETQYIGPQFLSTSGHTANPAGEADSDQKRAKDSEPDSSQGGAGSDARAKGQGGLGRFNFLRNIRNSFRKSGRSE
jgi:hypothetical protein